MTDRSTDPTAGPTPAPTIDRKALIEALTKAYPRLSPQLKQAARRVLDAPEEVAIKSMRGLATDAGVPPSTMVRLAKAAGFAGYDEFRRVFQEALRGAGHDLVSRAEWLQRLPEGGRGSQVVAGMAGAVLGNLEATFRGTEAATLEAAALVLRGARRVYIVGVGGMHPIAAYLHYIARMALPDVRLAAPLMATMIDELTDIGPEDAAVVLSVDPYAVESVRTAEFATSRNAAVIVVTDSRASPVAPYGRVLLLVPTATPQFFPSQAATIAVLETVVAMVVSGGDRRVLERIDRVDRHRRQQGIYWRTRG